MSHVKLSVLPVIKLSKQLDLRIKNHDALASLAQGRATRKDLDVIIASLNIAEALIMQNVGKEYRQQLRDAQDAVVCLAQRPAFVATGPELTAINWAMELHDAQLDVIPVFQLERAIIKVQQIVKSGGARPVVKETA